MMKKLKLQVQMSIDGFIAGPDNEMDWMTWNWDDNLKAYASELHDHIDTIIMGQSFAKGFIPHWQGVANDKENPEYDFAQVMVDVQKVIFSKTESDIDISEYKNAKINDQKLAEGVNALKQEAGKDIIVYGGSEFVSSLIAADLIDEYHLFINPIALGNGKTIFHQLDKNMPLSIDSVTKFDCGIVVMKYLKP